MIDLLSSLPFSFFPGDTGQLRLLAILKVVRITRLTRMVNKLPVDETTKAVRNILEFLFC